MLKRGCEVSKECETSLVSESQHLLSETNRCAQLLRIMWTSKQECSAIYLDTSIHMVKMHGYQCRILLSFMVSKHLQHVQYPVIICHRRLWCSLHRIFFKVTVSASRQRNIYAAIIFRKYSLLKIHVLVIICSNESLGQFFSAGWGWYPRTSSWGFEED